MVNKDVRGLFLIGLLFLILSCCKDNGLYEDQLNAYLLDKENGLLKSVSNGTMEIDVSYHPAELVWARELKSLPNADAMMQLKAKYDSLDYFILRFSSNGTELESSFVSDKAAFKQVIDHLSFDISEDLFLIYRSDTLRAIDAVYSRTFGGSAGTSVMVIFNSNLRSKDGDVKLFINDTVLGAGTNEFDFEISDIKNVPTLIPN